MFVLKLTGGFANNRPEARNDDKQLSWLGSSHSCDLLMCAICFSFWLKPLI